MQRMAEILSSKFNYNIDIFTSNAIDFKALREPTGRIIGNSNKYFNTVNNLQINRIPINYSVAAEEQIKNIKAIEEYEKLQLSDDALRDILKNGPYITEFLNSLKIKYDLIHTTFFPYFNLILGLIIGKKLDKPTVCTPFFHFSNPRYTDTPTKEILKKFDLLIACTNSEKRVLHTKLGIPLEKIKVIPMGVDYNKFHDLQYKRFKDFSFKNKFFKEKEKKYKMVLYCGYKNYEKGSLSVLKAIPLILNKFRKVYFVFIGPSTMAYNREVSKLVKQNHVRIINFTPDNLTGYFDKKKLIAFKEADIYIMPSRSDAYGIAFLEAWASGKPVIGANIGATPEVIKENVDGLLVEFDNPVDIAEKVITLLKKKRLSKKYGLAGKEKIIKSNTWDTIANITHKTYQDLIKSRK